MDNNFGFLKNFQDESLLNSLLEIQENINNEDFPFCSNLASAVEKSFKIILPPIIWRKNMETSLRTDSLSLELLFECLKEKFKNDRNPKGIPSTIPLAFQSIKINQNNDIIDKHQGFGWKKISLGQKISLLKQAHIIFKFINENWILDKQGIRNDNFNELTYYEKSQEVRSIRDEINIDEKLRNGTDDNLINVAKMNIHELLLSQEIAFIIPPYQRNYAWSETNIDDMLSGIYKNYNNNSESQFFGTIAITTEKDKFLLFKLIDGQQRITTSLIILKAVFNKMEQMGKSESIPTELKNQFSKDVEGKYQENLLKKISKNGGYIATDIELEALKALLKTDPFKERSDIKNLSKYKKTNVFKNYAIIKFFIEKNLKTYSKLEEFYKYFSSRYVVAVVNFKKSLNQEMEIFENLNSKGMYLGVLDLIKNSIFLKIEQDLFIKREEAIVNIFSKTIDLKNKITAENGGLRKTTKKLEELEKEFFYGYIVFKSKKTPKNNGSRALLRSFNSEILRDYNGIKDLDTYRKLSKEVGQYVQIFLDILEFDKQSHINYFLHDLYMELHIFNKKRSLIPILFYLLDVYTQYTWVSDNLNMSITSKNKINLKKSLLEVEKWMVSITQTRKSGGKSLTGTIIKLMRFLDKRKLDYDFKEELPTLIRGWLEGRKGGDKEFEGCPEISVGLRTANPRDFHDSLIKLGIEKSIQEILTKRLEIYAFNGESTDQEKLFKMGSIEHIIPQKIEDTAWVSYLTNDRIRLDNIIEIHLSKKDKLGNLLWIPQSSNSSLSNKNFEIKKATYYKKQICAAFIPIQDNGFNLLNVNKFDYSTLEKRTQTMARLLMIIYKWF